MFTLRPMFQSPALLVCAAGFLLLSTGCGETGPEGSTSTILYYIYRNIYEYQGKLGYAAALSVVLFVIVFAVTLINWRLNRAARER